MLKNNDLLGKKSASFNPVMVLPAIFKMRTRTFLDKHSYKKS
jgi:hypothetical protein